MILNPEPLVATLEGLDSSLQITVSLRQEHEIPVSIFCAHYREKERACETGGTIYPLGEREYEPLDLAICFLKIANSDDTTEDIPDTLRPQSRYALCAQWALVETAFNCKFLVFAKRIEKSRTRPTTITHRAVVLYMYDGKDPDSIVATSGFIEATKESFQTFALDLVNLYERMQDWHLTKRWDRLD